MLTNTKKLSKIAPNASKKIMVWEHTCQKCGHSWISRNKIVGTCPAMDCRSPNWNRDYSGMKK